MTYIAYKPYIAYQTYKAYQLDMKTLAQERYFSFSYIEENFLYIENLLIYNKVHINALDP